MKTKQPKHSIQIVLILLVAIMQLHGQLSIGDPGVKFDDVKYDSDYPFMKEWQKAGVQGGIPFF